MRWWPQSTPVYEKGILSSKPGPSMATRPTSEITVHRCLRGKAIAWQRVKIEYKEEHFSAP
jgi:hypothetical protein